MNLRRLILLYLMMNRYLGILLAGAFSATLMESAAQTKVSINTNFGEIPVLLFDDAAPNTVANFLSYVESGEYTDAIFHRAIVGFVLQSGGFRSTPTGAFLLEEVVEQDPIANEFGISNTRGTLAMAKLGGDPDSATSQWFINLDDNSSNLDNQNGGFTVFGEVEDFTVIDEIMSQNIINIGGVFSELPVVATREDGSAGPVNASEIRATDFVQISSIVVEPAASVPEPGAVSLLAVGSVGFILRRRR